MRNHISRGSGTLGGFRAAASAAILFAASLTTPSAAYASQITITDVEGFPNGRTYPSDLPPNAIDGDITTWTWTTNPNNISIPSYLAIGFGSTEVDRIRLWKSPAGGGGNNSKDLVIQYTTDVAMPLDSRTYFTVTSLTNGFNGTELWNATSVNGNGTVTGDVHNSGGDPWWGLPGDGWASLTFDPIVATGIRIGFSNPAPIVSYCTGAFANQACNHYRVAEFEAYGGQQSSTVPEPGTLSLIALIGGPLAARYRKRRA